MQDVDTYERLLEVWRSHETAENQAVALWEANAILHDRMPAWRLAVDGTIIAVNRLAAWIWGAPLDAGNIDVTGQARADLQVKLLRASRGGPGPR